MKNLNDRKKVTAAISGVLQYLEQEEPQHRAIEKPTGPPQHMRSNLWAVSARQQQMHIRYLMQMRAFHGTHRRA